MSELLLLLTTACALYLLLQRDLLCPATVYGAVTTANAWMFYITAVRRIHPQSVAHWWMFKYHYQDIAPTVFLILFSQAVVAVLARVAAKLLDRRLPSLTMEARQWTLAGRRFELTFRDPWWTFFGAFVVTSLLATVCIMHLLTIGTSWIWEYRGYLETRNPLQVDITSAPLQTFHRVLPHIGTVLCMLAAFLYSRREWGILSLLIFPTVYALAFTASLTSRFIVVQLASAGLVLFFLGSRRRIAAIVCLLAALMAYGTVLSLREYSGDGGVYGLGPFLKILLSGGFYPRGGVFSVLFNSLQGSFNLGHAVLMAPLDYPLDYKLKSFSLAPSAIDGFASLRLYAQRKANENAPYGAYAETYLFGVGWLAAYLVFMFAVLTYLGFFWRRCRNTAAVFVLCFSYLTCFLAHTYPIRNSFRLIVLSVIIAMMFSWYERYMNRQAGGAEWVSAQA